MSEVETKGRSPLQARSRERVARLLEAATTLIGRQGSDQLKMSEIAALAGTPIGSLYSYFPDKAAVIRALAETAYVDTRRCVEEALAAVNDRASLEAAWVGLIDQYWGLYQTEPVLKDIFGGVQADRGLTAMEIAESRVCGAFLASAVLRARPKADAAAVEMTAFLIWQLGESTMRLASSVSPGEAEAIVTTYRRIGLDALLAA